MDIHGFDQKLLRLSSEHIVDSLSCIINASLNSGRFFYDWKVARVTPVYKNCCDVHIMSNYQVLADSNFKYVLEIKDVPKFQDART